MAINKAYLQSGRTIESDECLTPKYAVTPVLPYLHANRFKTILCPFDKDDSNYVRVLKASGFTVVNSHLESRDFFNITDFTNIDCIVSNPPFSCKDKVLDRLYNIGLPFMMLLPQNAQQGIKRVNLFMKHGLEYMGFDKRVNFYTNGDLTKWKKGNHFASGYFCFKVLPEKLIFEKLFEIQEPY